MKNPYSTSEITIIFCGYAMIFMIASSISYYIIWGHWFFSFVPWLLRFYVLFRPAYSQFVTLVCRFPGLLLFAIIPHLLFSKFLLSDARLIIFCGMCLIRILNLIFSCFLTRFRTLNPLLIRHKSNDDELVTGSFNDDSFYYYHIESIKLLT